MTTETSSGESPTGPERKPRIIYKKLPAGRYKIRLHKEDKKYLQRLTDDITDIDSRFNVLDLKRIFGAMGWIEVSEHVFNALSNFYETKPVVSRMVKAVARSR